MSRLSVKRLYRFRLNGRKYCPARTGVKAGRLINDIIDAAEADQPLFSFRSRIRELRSINSRAALSFAAMAHQEDESILLVALWLRGLCSGPIGKDILADLVDHPNERIRIALTKAMQRMSGWDVLAEMQSDQSPRVRKLAQPKAQRSFADRMGEFSQSVTPVQTPDSHEDRELYVSPDLQVQLPIILRTQAVIRRVLERIRVLVETSRIS